MRALFATCALLLLVSSQVQAQDESPPEVIESAVSLLAEKMEGRREELAADSAALYALIEEILLPRFDRKLSAQLVLAKHWRTASEEQRDRFTQAFYQVLLGRYAEGLLEFDQDRVTIEAFRGSTDKPRAKVKTTVKLNDGTTVAVDYDLVKRDAGWLLFDVVIEGVSYVRNFRTEIDTEVRSTSLDAVIERLEAEAGI